MDKPVSVASQADPEQLAFVRSTPPFDRLPEKVLDALCLRMARIKLAAGKTLYEKAELGDAMYLVIGGRLQASGGSEGELIDPARRIWNG